MGRLLEVGRPSGWCTCFNPCSAHRDLEGSPISARMSKLKESGSLLNCSEPALGLGFELRSSDFGIFVFNHYTILPCQKDWILRQGVDLLFSEILLCSMPLATRRTLDS